MTVLILVLYFGIKTFLSETPPAISGGENSFYVVASICSSMLMLSMSALGMYCTESNKRLNAMLARLLPSLVLGFMLIAAVSYMVPSMHFLLNVLGWMFGVSGLSLLMTRFIYLKSSRLSLFEPRILFLGCGPLATECSHLAKANATTHQYDVVGFVAAEGDSTCAPQNSILKPESTLLETARKYKATEIVVSVQDRRRGVPIRELLECKLNGICVTDASTFFEREACQIRVNMLQPSWLVFGSGFDQTTLRVLCKRLFDLSVSVIVGAISLPVMLVTACLIWLEDRGPVFYRQERVGKDGRPYMVIKFRSMRMNAENLGAPQWASKDDPRVTRVGAVIRKLRIDELPQIWNVFKGEMSFVGPRPERPYFVDQLNQKVPYYNVRHSVKPGITGMAQVRYPYGASVEDAIQKLQYDLYYVKNNSLFLDLLILIDTVQVVLLGKGAR